ncbi:MAG: endonuclease/exonuclease/phosphatase family protein [Phycisphaerales bacterium]|nr:endonuclease/exonuclease/phosphatase family protein [Phycisphaerales bacterium]MCI0675500.1 endonuclease/exonuclease/phosphatase family protein [Phycisphaerales bacterium]
MSAKNAITLILSALVALGAGCNSTPETSSYVALSAAAPANRADDPSVADDGKTIAPRLSVLSFNLEHRDQPEQLAILAKRLRSDLAQVPQFILLQEVLFKRPKRKGQDNTAAALAEQLGYHCQGTKRTSDREGIAILSSYPFAYYDAITLKAQTSRLLLGFNRVSVMGEFLLPQIGRVRVVNVHFTNWGFERHIRIQQLRETLEWMDDRESKVHADVTIFGGDFNMPPDGSEASLITEANQSEEWEFLDHNSSQFTRGSPGNPTMRVDYLFVSAPDHRVRMVGEEQLLWQNGLLAKPGKESSRFWLSDHLPVLHEYSFRQTVLPAVAQGSLDHQSGE